MINFYFKQVCTKLFVVFLSLMMFSITSFNPVSIKTSPAELCSAQTTSGFPSIKKIIKTLFNKKDDSEDINKEKIYVYLGGYPLGFTINSKGVVVVSVSNETCDLKEGDILTKIEDIEVNNAGEIFTIINSQAYSGKMVSITYLRENKEKKSTIKPIFDYNSCCYKLGVWIRDDSAGVGTLTYIRKDNLRFGALGHPVCDIDTGSLIPLLNGNIYRCNIVGYKTGVKGNPGELRGLFLRNGKVLGNLNVNNKFGVYGNFSDNMMEDYSKELVEVASRNEVKSGKAKIRCTIDGIEPKEYDIEIVKTYFQKTKDNKSMFIRITDKELLEKTGGIIQGMSGSPIIQNGKLVGAVTHVFVSDPTKGYGVYADWMIDN